MRDKGLNQLSIRFSEGRYPAEVRRVSFDQQRIEVVLADQDTKPVSYDFQQFVAGTATLCFKQRWPVYVFTIAAQSSEVQAKRPSSSRFLIMEPNRDIASSMKARRSGEVRGNP